MTISNQSFEFTVKLYKVGNYWTVSVDPHELSLDRLYTTRAYVDAHRFFLGVMSRFNYDYFILSDKQYVHGGAITATYKSRGYFRETS